jgi:hypothetical protein
MKKAQLFDKIDASVWDKQWVADSQAVGQGQNSLRYLSRYVFRVAISNNRIKSIENNAIKFQYKDRRTKTWKIISLDAMEFIRRFLQHVLPKGFMKIRHYGFLNPNSSFSIENLRELISVIHDAIIDFLPVLPEYVKEQIKCACCGKPLQLVAFLKHIPPIRGPSG